MRINKKVKLVVLGGGTGTFVILSGLKKYSRQLDISAVVTMFDSGGSTGRLRDQLGVLPPGDLRQCLVALSRSDLIWRKLFLYRFDSGDLKGHNFGNLFLSALEKITASYKEALDYCHVLLQCQGRVMPVTFDQAHLLAYYKSGKVINKEAEIDNYRNINDKILKIQLDRKVSVNKSAVACLESAEFVILGPGDIYTSIVPVLLVPEIVQAIKNSKAKIVFFVNLFTKPGETHNFTAKDYVTTIEKYLQRSVDYIIINKEPIKKEIIEHYQHYNSQVVTDDLGTDKRVIRANLLSKRIIRQSEADTVSRSLLRHSYTKTAKIILKIIKSTVL
ncbi:MAG: putative gluconeogenesis factor [Patescibacteria group bacterium]|nr:MAG: putative gluconeogenesis factor [Patescibacteria group bacterium]